MASEISEFDFTGSFSTSFNPFVETSIWNGRQIQLANRASPNLQSRLKISSNWIGNFLKIIGQRMMEEPDLLSLSKPPLAPPSFSTIGPKQTHFQIGGINGINTGLENATAHANYLASFASGQGIDWVYNQSHGLPLDLIEVLSLNYLGCSPNTCSLLCANWTDFHEKNQGNPRAKYLQFCHSQGTIHVRNALAKLPQEIRDRVLVVAIAPAAVVPGKICFKSFNYASKKDCIHLGEFIHSGPLNEYDFKNSNPTLATHQELIRLDPHPDVAGNLDHDFQSPTFRNVISEHILDYLNRNGNYTI